jgi:hypothetical protein
VFNINIELSVNLRICVLNLWKTLKCKFLQYVCVSYTNIKVSLHDHMFNVFHVRAIYYTKNTDHQQMHKESFIINCNTLLHVSTLLGHLQGELFVIITLGCTL